MKRPVIGYTTRNGILNFLHCLTAISILISGGRPLKLSPKKPHYNRKIDGLIINGGTDLYPARYHGDPKPDYIYDEARDEMEVKWLEMAETENMPVLGICRGAQLMNVMRGGTLHVDVSKIYERANYPTGLLANVMFRKYIKVIPGLKLYNILNTNGACVNSMHKQAIDSLGGNLTISAKEKNGVVQAIEDNKRPYYIGVQFHPEALIYKKKFRAIFKKLILIARNNQRH